MKSVVVCASKKYRKEVAAFCSTLRDKGVVVFEPNISNPIDESAFIHSQHLTNIVFKGLTLEHFDKIRKADVCFIYNKHGYAGVSVTLEIGFAAALGKRIYSLEASTGDPCRDSLIDGIVPDGEALIRLLQ